MPAMSPILKPYDMDLNVGRTCSGPKLGPCWPKLAPSRANVAATSDRNGFMWTILAICKTYQNVRVTAVPCTFCRPALQSDRSVRSYPALLNWHRWCGRISFAFPTLLKCKSQRMMFSKTKRTEPKITRSRMNRNRP